MPDNLRKSPLNGEHEKAGATFGPSGGCNMPLHFGTPLEEAAAGLKDAIALDCSQFGRLRIRGDGALDLLNRACTADILRQEDDFAQPTLLLDDNGGIIDAVMLLRLESFWVMVTSPGNDQAVADHLASLNIPGAKIDNQTAKVAQIAVVGPTGARKLNAVLPMSLAGLPDGSAKMGSMMIANYIAMRTSPCGGWGLQVMLTGMFTAQAWKFITGKAGDNAMRRAGTLAMDMLRLHAGLPKFGAELNRTVDPVTAGLMEQVNMDHDFLGREALEKIIAAGPQRKRVLMSLAASGEQNGAGGAPVPPAEKLVQQELHQPGEGSIPKQGDVITASDGREVGNVTSASLNPAGDGILAMGYVAADAAEPETALTIAGISATITQTF